VNLHCTQLGRAMGVSIALPFVGADAFRRASTTVDRTWFQAHFPDACADTHTGLQAADMFADVWGGGGTVDSVDLLDGLHDIADRLLDRQGHTCILRLPLASGSVRPGEEILRWCMIRLFVPAHVMVAARWAENGEDVEGPAPARVQLLDRSIAPAGEVAHLHLHSAGEGRFDFLVSHVMSGLDLKRLDDAPPGTSTPEWRAVLAAAALARRALSWMVTHGDDAQLDDGFARRALEEFAAGDTRALVARDLTHLVRTARSTRGRRVHVLRDWDDLCRQDPLARGDESPEVVFVHRAFRFARQTGHDSRFRRLFAQYLRVICTLHQRVVSQPSRGGLAAFKGCRDALKQYSRGAENVLARAGLESNTLNLRAVEFRFSLRPDTQPVVERAAREPVPFSSRGLPMERGIVLHLLRSDGEGKRGARRPGSWRYEADRRGELEALLRRRPVTVPVVRGLDLASQEIDRPLFIYAGALRAMRQAADEAARRHGLRGPGLTLHLGEDFRTALAGLRAVAEPFEWGLLRRGDRLGHATAAGICAAELTRRRPAALQPAWERLLDLLWILGVAAQPEARAEALDAATIRRVEREVAERLEALVLPNDRAVVEGVHRDLGRLPPLDSPEPERASPAQAAFLLAKAVAHRHPDAWAPVQVRPEDDAALTRFGAVAVRQMLAANQIAVEMCPTSNMLVAGLDFPLEQPGFGHRADSAERPAVVSEVICADDPLIFATTLEDEFAYAWAGLTAGLGRSHGYVTEYLEERARASWRVRFTA